MCDDVWCVTTRNYYGWAGWTGFVVHSFLRVPKLPKILFWKKRAFMVHHWGVCLVRKPLTNCYRARKSLNMYTHYIYMCVCMSECVHVCVCALIDWLIDSFIHSCIYLHPYNILTYPTYNWLITMAMGLLQGSVQRCRIPCKICCPVPSQSWTFQVEKMEDMRKVVITKLILQGWTIGVPAGWVLAGFSDQCDGYGIL